MSHFLVLDLETTGFSPEKGDTIIDIGAIICDEKGIVKTFQSLVSPGNTPVSDFVYTLTGITPEMLQDAPSREKVLADFKEFIEGYEDLPVVGHNIQFDCNFLNTFGFSFRQENYLDTNDFSTLLFPEISSHSLEILSSYFEIDHVEKHRAIADVYASYELLKILKKQYKDLWIIKYGDKIDTFMKKQQWGGRHFFSLNIETNNTVITIKEPQKTDLKSYYKNEKNKIFSDLKTALTSEQLSFVGIPSFLETQKALMHAVKEKELKNIVILGNNTDLDGFKECGKLLQWREQLFLFEHPSQVLVKEKIETLWDKSHINDAECVFILRMLFAEISESFILASHLKLTHRERTLLSQYCVSENDSEELKTAFEDYLGSFPVVITSFHQYFCGTHAALLQQKEEIIIMNAMCLEPNILDATRSYLTLDALKRSIEKLRVFHFNSPDFSTILESLQLNAQSTFEKIGKKLSRTQRIQAELREFDEEMKDLFTYFQRGITALKNVIEEKDASVQSVVLAVVEHVEKHLDLFTEYQSDDLWFYAKSYNNQVTLFREEKTLAKYKTHLLEKGHITLLDSDYDPEFSYFIEPEIYFCIEQEEIKALIQNHIDFEFLEDSEVKEVEKNDVSFFKSRCDSEKKSIILCNTGAKLDKIFELLYSELSAEDYSVVSFGKTGGMSKVEYMFSNTQKGVLVTKLGDFLRLESSTQTQEILLHSLPFPNIQGMYYDSLNINTFEKYTIPVTLKAMKEILYKSLQFTPENRIVVKFYDPRMYTKDYGRKILKDLF